SPRRHFPSFPTRRSSDLGSTKAQFFRARLAQEGIALEIPDLAPDFTHLTMTGMLGIVEAILARGPAVLLGSSLGGYLAALAAARSEEHTSELQSRVDLVC